MQVTWMKCVLVGILVFGLVGSRIKHGVRRRSC